MPSILAGGGVLPLDTISLTKLLGQMPHPAIPTHPSLRQTEVPIYISACTTEALAGRVLPEHDAPRAVELDPRPAPLPPNIVVFINETLHFCRVYRNVQVLYMYSY